MKNGPTFRLLEPLNVDISELNLLVETIEFPQELLFKALLGAFQETFEHEYVFLQTLLASLLELWTI